MAVNEEYQTKFVAKMDKLRLQRENALNERYPKRKEERHDRKKVIPLCMGESPTQWPGK
jgi:hypothetical protein